MRFIWLLAIVLVLGSAEVSAQKRRARAAAKTPAVKAAPPAETTSDKGQVVPVQPEPKKNERPIGDGIRTARENPSEPTHFYEFSQPEFVVSKMVIEHDESGKGKITFTRKLFSDTWTDPLEVSPAALERINAAYTALNFLDSTENYQYEKDYSHLGTMTFRLKKGDKQRTAKFNYTTNKDAKVLADEYRKLGTQFVWIFDITVARENQPLDAPRLLDSLDSLIRRKEISDPNQMLPLLKDLADDERIPLIARNHAARLVKQIGK